MVLILEKIPRKWTILGLSAGALLGILFDGVIPRDIDHLHRLMIFAVVGAVDIGIFFEELKEKYFLDFEKKRDSVLLMFFLFGVLFITFSCLRFKEVSIFPMLETSSVLRYVTEFSVGLLIFLTTIFLQRSSSSIDYRESHRKTGELCKKICMFREKQHYFENEKLKDEIEDILKILEFLRVDVRANIKKENEEARKPLRKFLLSIIAIENLLKSYYNFFPLSEISRVISSSGNPLFLRTRKENGTSFSEAFEIASKSVPKFKKQLSKSRIEGLLVKPLFALIPGCKTYSELYSWKHPKHDRSIGQNNDDTFHERYIKTPGANSGQLIVIFDLYGKPPSSFNDKATFISQLKASNRHEELFIAFLYLKECLREDMCTAGIETLKEFARRKPDLKLKSLEITNDESSLLAFLDDCYDFYTYIPSEDLQKKPRKKYRWYLNV